MFSIKIEDRSPSHQNNVQLWDWTFNLLLQSGKMMLDWINKILQRESFGAKGVMCPFNPLI